MVTGIWNSHSCRQAPHLSPTQIAPFSSIVVAMYGIPRGAWHLGHTIGNDTSGPCSDGFGIHSERGGSAECIKAIAPAGAAVKK